MSEKYLIYVWTLIDELIHYCLSYLAISCVDGISEKFSTGGDRESAKSA